MLKISDVENKFNLKNDKVSDIKNLDSAKKNDITFFHSSKYSEIASNTKASYCITSENLSGILPIKCKKIIVNNVLISTAKIAKSFYPTSVNDHFDPYVKDINKTIYRKKVLFGKNVLIGKKCKNRI